MVVVHLDGLLGVFNPAGSTAVAWKNVASRSSSLFFTVTYILLLGAALYHGFYGLRTILFELGLRKPTQHFLTIFFWVIGVCLFFIGTLAAIVAKAVNPVI
jgi:succinate dehydrogenase / fumarate reductase membrane anchor subunit